MNETGDIVKDYLSRFPSIPSRRIAKWINEKYPEFSVEKARSAIRYYRQQQGVAARGRITTDDFANQKYDLPLPSSYDSSDFLIPESNVLILTDTQIPFHSIQAIETTIDHAKKLGGIDAILLDGDIIDNYQLSTFSRDPRERNIQEEISDCIDFLEMLTEEFKGVPIYYKFGNHEERYERYIYQHAEQLAFLQDATFEKILHLDRYNAKVIKDKRVIKIGHLNVLHGHEIRSGFISPVNPARTIFLKAKAHTLVGHWNVTSEHSGRTIEGKLITCWSVGCLCNLKPKFNPINDWNTGAAIVRREKDTFRVNNFRIERGIVY